MTHQHRVHWFDSVWVWYAVILLAILLGVAIRLWITWHSVGSDDMLTWVDFAELLSQHDVAWMYQHVTSWNHPPLMGVLVSQLALLSAKTGWNFMVLFKSVPIMADVGSMVLLWHIWFRKDSPRVAALAVLVFALSINAILISGYHGNTDSLVAFLVLLACYVQERWRNVWFGGLILALALQVKLIPLFLIPLWLLHVRSWKDRALLLIGILVGLLPFVPVVVEVGRDFYRNALAYNSNFDNWGLALFVLLIQKQPAWLAVGVGAQKWLMHWGRYVVLAGVLALGVWSRHRSHYSFYDMSALGLAVFLLLTPGFGVQYTAILGPVLCAANWRLGKWYGLVTGVFVLAVYVAFLTKSQLYYSHFTSVFPYPAAWFGLVAWLFIGFAIWRLLDKEIVPADAKESA